MSSRRLLSIVVLLGAAVGATACGPSAAPVQDREDVRGTPASSTGSCGVERWAIKTGSDSAAAQVNLTPQDTTIAALAAIPVPSGFGQNSPRETYSGSPELQVYRLTNVMFTVYKLENDSDYHMVLTQNGSSMIAEIPDPACVSGGPFASAISSSRRAFDARYTASGSFQTANVPVTVTGVGFFDLLHGQTGVAPNGIELHAVLSVCFGTNCAGTATPDFALSASPAAVTDNGTSTLSATGSGGFSSAVSLSTNGVPAGATASLSRASITPGTTSVLTLNKGTAAAGSYNVVVTGTSGSLSHATSVAWTIGGTTTGGGLTNGGFEPALAGWTSTGTTSSSTVAHGGTHSAQVGSTGPTTDSSLAQTFTLPANATALSFWYRVVCPDTVTYDWASATLRDNTSGTTTTMLANTCTNSGAWVQASANVTGGHSVTLTLSNHDDNYAGDATYTLFDDVTVTTSGGGDTTPPTAQITAPAAGASVSGTVAVTATATDVDSTVSKVDLYADGALIGSTAGSSATVQWNTTTVANGSHALVAKATDPSGNVGTSATVTVTVSNSGPPPSTLVNGGFESGLTGWTTSGTAAVVTGGHTGSAAQLGSTSPSTDSSVSQTFTIPPGGGVLSFWVKVVCPDTVTYDWASATLVDNTVAGTTTLLANTCTNSGTWVQVTQDLTAKANHSVTLKLANHDDNYAGDATYTLFDDVQLVTSNPPPPPPPPPTADFSLTLGSGSVSSTGSAAATDSVTIGALNGFSGNVALSVSGLPTGASASFNPASVTGSGSSTLTLSPGTAAAGTYALTVTGTSGSLSHSAALSWTLSAGTGTGLQTVFIILMENHNWSSISGSASAPYINNTLLPQASYALNYTNPPGIHPSLPNYLWLEAGTNFGILDDNLPSTNRQTTTQHLVTLLQNAGISWKSYQEGISGTSCPVTVSGLYAPKHNPMVYFTDVTNSSSNCVAHVRPYSELATDLSGGTVARYNFITPDQCHDMHNSSGCATTDSVANGDTWLSQNVPQILNSAAYRSGGALFITWDESEGGDFPVGMIVLSPQAKGGGYTNNIAYTHGSTLRTMQEIFHVTPLLGGAATSTNLGDLFRTFP